MTLKEKAKENPGFQYIIDNLEIISSTARQHLLNQPFRTSPTDILTEHDNIDAAVAILNDPTNGKSISVLRHQFMQLHDLSGSIQSLRRKVVLDEVELFEIKQLAHITAIARREVETIGLAHRIDMPDTTPIFQLLDPDRTSIPTFYIYDSYDTRLTPIRRELKALQVNPDTTENASRLAALFDAQQSIQQEVLLGLTERLSAYAETIQQAEDQMAYCDILFAKAQQVQDLSLHRPTLSNSETHFKALFNPRLRQRKEALKLRYQPVDISLGSGTCIITGANMAGKTVLLKSISVAQLMTQFGMFVPAEESTVALVDDVLLCIGDEQNEMNGLSSFASEIIKISDTLTRSKNEKLLILIDEPARTTNPIEGQAIVHSIASILNERSSFTLLTTHYSQLKVDCRRLRVKGFVEDLTTLPLTPSTINQFMDYSLLEETQEEVPHEALRIASILGCDGEMIEQSLQYLEEEN